MPNIQKQSQLKRFNNIKYTFLLYLILNLIKSSENACPNGVYLSDTSCFDNIITIKKNFRAGQFATNVKGDMIAEYSNNDGNNLYKRLFFGLKKNGRGYFPDENSIKEKDVKYTDTSTGYGRYESRNLFVCLEKDFNRNKEYLFSTSTWDSLTELHDIENDTYVSRGTRNIFETLDIFSYEFSLIELKESNQMSYFVVFTEHEADKVDNKDYSKKFKIVKFKLTSYNLNTGYYKLAEYTNWNNFNDRIVSPFLLENHDLLAVFYLNNERKYKVAYYDYNLGSQGEYELYNTGSTIDELDPGNGVYFKAIYLKDDKVIFLFYLARAKDYMLKLRVKKFNSGNKDFETNVLKYDKDYYFMTDVILNDFLKIDDTHLVHITSQNEYKRLYFLFYDFNNDYTNIKMRLFKYEISNYQLRKEFRGYIYNGFFVFTSTLAPYNSEDFFSYLIFLSYANGTDFEIDISPYLMDTGYYNSNNNIFTRLMKNLTIENNIFQYDAVQKINLVSIPDELIFYNVTNGVQDANKLPNYTFFDSNHKLYQNRAINKTDRYYYLDYQYIVKEPVYSTFYDTTNKEVLNFDSNNNNFESIYTRKTFYGRTNRLKFK